MKHTDLIKLCSGGSWLGPSSVEVITAYEEVLGMKFPEDYREFLQNFGSGHKDGIEIAGVSNLIHGDLNVIGRTVLQRRSYRHFPQGAIYISDSGDGGQICIDSETGEVMELHAQPPSGVFRDTIAPDFYAFLEKSFRSQ